MNLGTFEYKWSQTEDSYNNDPEIGRGIKMFKEPKKEWEKEGEKQLIKAQYN